jgi:hypothetical protein
MRVTNPSQGRLLAYVDVKVASRIFRLPVAVATPATGEENPTKEGFFPDGAGFLPEGAEGLRILVDAKATESERQATIARASADAERFISRKLLN